MAFGKKESAVVEIQRLRDEVIELDIVGVTPLIPHRWSEKAREMMPGHPQNAALKSKKGIREPQREADACTYWLPDGRLGMPATAFKAAIISACRFFDKPTMTEAKLLVFVEGEGPEQLVPVTGSVRLREDTPRNSNGGADLRYRNEISDWTATLRVRFVPTSISAESVAALVDAAGRCGVGDWRPSAPKSSTGTYGTWRVVDEESQA